ncbi:MAG: hypothetical protein ACREMC_07075 [Gemmatimonadales bacterium]
MTAPELDRRDITDRRRGGDQRAAPAPVPIERRKSARRSGVERRLALQSAAFQLRAALELLERVAESRKLSDDDRRSLDTAMLRLRFAVERMAQP